LLQKEAVIDLDLSLLGASAAAPPHMW
jgi:hypothetical protein